MNKDKIPSHHGYKEKKKGRFPNATMKLLVQRASCRNFANKKIPKSVLDMILETGTHAATGGNLQPYSIIKIETKEKREKLAKMCYQNFIAKAPVSLIFCIDWRRLQRWAEIEKAPFTATSSFRHFWISFQDTIICAQNICTAADSFGLGSVYIGTIMDLMREVREMFELPKGVLPVVLLCLGYPKSKPLVRRKLGREVIVHDEKYHEMSNGALKNAYGEKYHHAKIETTDERLKRMREVCQKVHGKSFADKCLYRIKQNGFINVAQRYFGLHYAADIMPDGNEDFIKTMKEFGFDWFERFKPKRYPNRYKIKEEK
ncbi:MAG: nitroreductase family protein [candidate division WOR-3 bacterium]|nr:nitroreductase family protein [candidate division WOR-3 bacterium]